MIVRVMLLLEVYSEISLLSVLFSRYMYFHQKAKLRLCYDYLLIDTTVISFDEYDENVRRLLVRIFFLKYKNIIVILSVLYKYTV